MFRVPEKYRQGPTSIYIPTTSLDGNNGVFIIPAKFTNLKLFCIASDGMGWEHVSVSLLGSKRCPVWEEMCYVKDLFWSEEDCVIQYHPRKEDYVNVHPYCLHLWRPVGLNIPTPPKFMVG